MCTFCPPRPSRRAFLAGLGAAALSAPAAFAAPPVACWSPTELVAKAGEGARRHRSPADAFASPQPAEPAPPVTGARAGVIRRFDLPAGDKRIALTFDLCQTRGAIAGYDGAIVDILRAGSVAATFFPTGRWLATHPARAGQLSADPLFLLANHSFSHPDLHFAPAGTVRQEILLTEAALASTRAAADAACHGTAKAPPVRLFRFPYGSCAPAGVAAANAAGSVIIQWDVVSGDPDGTSARLIERNVLSAVRPGSIVVMHANGRGTHTAEALRTIIPELRGEGFSFATVAELLAAGRPVTTEACYINHPGDTVRYDSPKRRMASASHGR